jgi:hypothetical protein
MSEKPDLHDMAAAVDSKAAFLEFVRALIADREDDVAQQRENPSSPWGPGANGWENGSIESYLESAVAWADDDTDRLPDRPGWREFARFLLAGKHYE